MNKEQLSCPLPEVWISLDDDVKRQLLDQGRCLPGQGYIYQEEMIWGHEFQFRHSPIVSFSLLLHLEALDDALRLGACPFALDYQESGIFSRGFELLSDPAQSDVCQSMIQKGWNAGKRFLDPSNIDAFPQNVIDQIKFHIAKCCYKYGATAWAHSIGMDVNPSWFLNTQPDFDTGEQYLRYAPIQWGNSDSLQRFIEAGFDAVTPVHFTEKDLLVTDDSFESLWTWVTDSNLDDIQKFCSLLLDAGNDPRRPISEGGPTVLSIMKDDGLCPNVVKYLEQLFLTQEEYKILSLDTSEPSSSKQRSFRV